MTLSYGQIASAPLARCDMATKKIRLDQLIVDRGLAESKTRAHSKWDTDPDIGVCVAMLHCVLVGASAATTPSPKCVKL